MTSIPGMISTTWRRKGGLARWRIRVPLPAEQTPRDTLVNLAIWVVDQLEDFGQAAEASWTSATLGEDALVQDLGADPHATPGATSLADPVSVSLCLNLFYTDPRVPALVLERAADLWLEIDADAGAIGIVLFLDVDFYAWRSWGRDRDNHATAELNAPRLRGFLERLQRAPGASIEDVDAPDYPGQVDALGFHPPD